MSFKRSDNRYEAHPKPVQDGERKETSPGVWEDYVDDADVLANTTAAYRSNKYFWVAGTYKHCDSDGTTLRIVGGGGSSITNIKSLQFLINADGSGTPDSTFDGYIAAGNSLTDSRLISSRIIQIIRNAEPIHCFGGDYKAGYTPSTGSINFTAVGGLTAGDVLSILYKPQS